MSEKGKSDFFRKGLMNVGLVTGSTRQLLRWMLHRAQHGNKKLKFGDHHTLFSSP
jgi:hypothetical protein